MLRNIDIQCILPAQSSTNVPISGLFGQTSDFFLLASPQRAVKPIPLQALHIPAKKNNGGCRFGGLDSRNV